VEGWGMNDEFEGGRGLFHSFPAFIWKFSKNLENIREIAVPA
jgi:hypothetical protein